MENLIQGNYHQGNERYGEIGGIQWTSNTYFAICYSKIRNIPDW